MEKPTIVVHAYPVYVDDWIGSETRMETNLEQRMLLWELIFRCFKEGSLPTDEAKLRKIADCSTAEWSRSWPKIRHKFEERNGRLHHPRVDGEMARITEARQKASLSGKSGARKRWAAYGHPIATPQNGNSGQPMLPQCDSIASEPNPIPNPNPTRAIPIEKEPNGWDPQIAFEELAAAYPAHRSSRAVLAQQNYIAATGGTEEKHKRLMKLLVLCKDSEDWTKDEGQYVLGMAKWLSDPPWHLLKAQEAAPPKRKPMVEMTVKELEAAGLLPWQQ